jgi:hypothetical protein
MTETELRVIEILTQHEVTANVWGEPIYAVDRAMDWATAYTKEVVTGLMNRKLVEWTPIVRDGPAFDPREYWKKGSAYPQSSGDSEH